MTQTERGLSIHHHAQDACGVWGDEIFVVMLGGSTIDLHVLGVRPCDTTVECQAERVWAKNAADNPKHLLGT
jgi:hypothetical protein